MSERSVEREARLHTNPSFGRHFPGLGAAVAMVGSVISTEDITGLGQRRAIELSTAGSSTQTVIEFIGPAVSR